MTTCKKSCIYTKFNRKWLHFIDCIVIDNQACQVRFLMLPWKTFWPQKWPVCVEMSNCLDRITCKQTFDDNLPQSIFELHPKKNLTLTVMVE